MQSIWALVGKDMLRYFSDRRAMVVNLAVPLVLTFIMGLSFGGGLFGQSTGISAIPLLLVGESIPEMLQERLAEGLRESGFFTATWTDSLTADHQVRHGDAAAALVFPDDFFNSFLNQEEVSLQLWKDPGSPFKSGIVQQVVTRGLLQYQAGEAAYGALWPEDLDQTRYEGLELSWDDLTADGFTGLWQRMRTSESDTAVDFLVERMTLGLDHGTALAEGLNTSLVSLTVEDKAALAVDGDTREFNLFDFFLPSFAVFFLMFSISASCRDLHREMVSGTLQRQLVSPLRGRDILLGKWLSAALAGMLQLLVLMGVGAVLFRVNLGPDVFSLPLTVALSCLAGAGVFLLLSLVSRNEKMMDNLSTVVVLVSAMIGGNFVPVDNLPDFLRPVGQLTFNFWANQSFLSIMSDNESVTSHPEPLWILALITVLTLGTSFLVFRQRARRGGLT